MINSEVGQPVGVDLEFAGATVSVRSVRGEPVVDVIPASRSGLLDYFQQKE